MACTGREFIIVGRNGQGFFENNPIYWSLCPDLPKLAFFSLALETYSQGLGSLILLKATKVARGVLSFEPSSLQETYTRTQSEQPQCCSAGEELQGPGYRFRIYLILWPWWCVPSLRHDSRLRSPCPWFAARRARRRTPAVRLHRWRRRPSAAAAAAARAWVRMGRGGEARCRAAEPRSSHRLERGSTHQLATSTRSVGRRIGGAIIGELFFFEKGRRRSCMCI